MGIVGGKGDCGLVGDAFLDLVESKLVEGDKRFDLQDRDRTTDVSELRFQSINLHHGLI